MKSYLAAAIHFLFLVSFLAPTGSIKHCGLVGIFVDPVYVVQCIGIDQDNMMEVTAILTEIKYRYWDKVIALQFLESVGADFPEDILQGYKIISLAMTNCGFTELPYGLLSNLHERVVSLDFSNNRIQSIDAERLNALPFVSHVSALSLHSNNLTGLPPDGFANYTNLKSLTLQDNCLEELVDNVFRGLTSLQGLYLFGNDIEAIGTGAFAGLLQLQLLAMDMNRIKFMDEGTLSRENQTSLMEVPLEGNPFRCTCSLQWLKDYLISIDYLVSSGATCTYPRIGPFAAIDFCAQDTTGSNPTINPHMH